MGDLIALLLTCLLIFIPFGIVFYLIRRNRKKNELKLTSRALEKKYTNEISSFTGIVMGVIAHIITGNWFMAGIVGGTVTVILLYVLRKKSGNSI